MKKDTGKSNILGNGFNNFYNRCFMDAKTPESQEAAWRSAYMVGSALTFEYIVGGGTDNTLSPDNIDKSVTLIRKFGLEQMEIIHGIKTSKPIIQKSELPREGKCDYMLLAWYSYKELLLEDTPEKTALDLYIAFQVGSAELLYMILNFHDKDKDIGIDRSSVSFFDFLDKLKDETDEITDNFVKEVEKSLYKKIN